MSTCKYCGDEIIIRSDKLYDKQKQFCNHSCSAKFSNANRRVSPITKDKIRSSLQKYATSIGKHICIKNTYTKTCTSCGVIYDTTSIKSKRCRQCIDIAKLKTHKCVICDVPCSNKTCSIKCTSLYKKQKTNSLILTGIATGTKSLKRYLIDSRGHVCEICKSSEWMGNPIPLIMDHINGRAADNSLDNLRLVCPNCDHQLPTFGSKNKHSDRKKRFIYSVSVDQRIL